MKTIGIVGYGSFGKFLVDKLSGQFKVLVYSRRHQPGENIFVSLDDMAKTDFLILSIPLEAYEEYLTKLRSILTPNTVIVDVCSVKVKPIKIIRQILPDQPLLATHPLFGPESAAKSLKGHTLVICPEVSNKLASDRLVKLAKEQGLNVLVESAKIHDQQMATVHALTFFIARALDKYQLKSHKFDTPSYKRLLYLAELDTHHSDELFQTIETGNPYAKAARHKFINLMNDLDKSIKD
jgi:prephenate dehydrogenase